MNGKNKMILMVLAVVIVSGLLLFNAMIIPNKSNSIQTTIQSSQSGTIKYDESIIEKLPKACYIIYQNPEDKASNATAISFYNTTVIPILNSPQIKGNYTVFKSFMNLPETELYFYSHCLFLNNRITSVPALYNASLGTNQTQDTGIIRLNIIKEKLLIENNFVAIANKNTKLSDIATFFIMTEPEVVQKLIDNHLLSLHDCVKSTEPNSTAYDCRWKDSTFYYDAGSGQILDTTQNTLDAKKNTINNMIIGTGSGGYGGGS